MKSNLWPFHKPKHSCTLFSNINNKNFMNSIYVLIYSSIDENMQFVVSINQLNQVINRVPVTMCEPHELVHLTSHEPHELCSWTEFIWRFMKHMNWVHVTIHEPSSWDDSWTTWTSFMNWVHVTVHELCHWLWPKKVDVGVHVKVYRLTDVLLLKNEWNLDNRVDELCKKLEMLWFYWKLMGWDKEEFVKL